MVGDPGPAGGARCAAHWLWAVLHGAAAFHAAGAGCRSRAAAAAAAAVAFAEGAAPGGPAVRGRLPAAPVWLTHSGGRIRPARAALRMRARGIGRAAAGTRAAAAHAGGRKPRCRGGRQSPVAAAAVRLAGRSLATSRQSAAAVAADTARCQRPAQGAAVPAPGAPPARAQSRPRCCGVRPMPGTAAPPGFPPSFGCLVARSQARHLHSILLF